MMIEGFRSGSIPLANGSGSGAKRPKTYGSDGSGSATLLVRTLLSQLLKKAVGGPVNNIYRLVFYLVMRPSDTYSISDGVPMLSHKAAADA